MEKELSDSVNELSRYESTMNTNIMQLNNDIGSKKKEQDEIQSKVA